MSGTFALAAVLASLVAFTARAEAGAELLVEIDRVRSSDGVIRIAVYDNAQDWLNADVVGRVLPAVKGVTTVAFPDLVPGIYAIAAYHDENGNGRFDKVLGTLPAEGYGFSNNVRPFLSPPPFDGAAFEVVETAPTAIRFKIVYP